MSLVTTRLALVHRCTIERNLNAGTDDGWSNPLPPDWETLTEDVFCRGWVASHETVTSKSDLVVVLEVHLIVLNGTDITENDRVASITLRGETFIDGPLDVHAVLPQRDYLEVILAKAL